MNTQKILLIGSIVVVALSFAVYMMSTKSQPTPLSQQESQELPLNDSMNDAENKVVTGDVTTNTSTTDKYVEYSKSAFDQASSNRRALFFYASWCPTCRPADASFKENSAQIPVDVTVIRVNYNDDDTDDAEKALARKYGVGYQHTFVQIDSQGKEVTKWNGGGIEELLENIR